MTMANNITAQLHTQQSKINSFFTLRQTADSLIKRNTELQNGKKDNWLPTDSSVKEIADYIPIDTFGNMKKVLRFVYRPSFVIYNTTNDDKKNYMMLARGKNDGIGVDMAVIGAESNSVIGKTVYADSKYSVVMTLLHDKSKVPAKLQRTGENGTVTWNGQNNRIVTMNKIPKSAEVKTGDSIVTSSSSDIFPENLLIGTIDTFYVDKSTGYLDIRVKTAANFNKINYVQVVENIQQKETRTALDNAKKALNDKN
jgi:rod shape-determining protein MreC